MGGCVDREVTRFVLGSRWEGSGPLQDSELRSDRSHLTSQQTPPAAASVTDDREAKANGEAAMSFQ